MIKNDAKVHVKLSPGLPWQNQHQQTRLKIFMKALCCQGHEISKISTSKLDKNFMQAHCRQGHAISKIRTSKLGLKIL
jgi:hypothetical protein